MFCQPIQDLWILEPTLEGNLIVPHMENISVKHIQEILVELPWKEPKIFGFFVTVDLGDLWWT